MAVGDGNIAIGGSLTVNSIANTLDAHIKNAPTSSRTRRPRSPRRSPRRWSWSPAASPSASEQRGRCSDRLQLRRRQLRPGEPGASSNRSKRRERPDHRVHRQRRRRRRRRHRGSVRLPAGGNGAPDEREAAARDSDLVRAGRLRPRDRGGHVGLRLHPAERRQDRLERHVARRGPDDHGHRRRLERRHVRHRRDRRRQAPAARRPRPGHERLGDDRHRDRARPRRHPGRPEHGNDTTARDPFAARIVSVTIGAAAANQTAIGGSISINVIAHSITAYISGARAVKAGGSILVSGADDLNSISVAGGVAVGQNAAGIAVSLQIDLSRVSAYVGAGTTIDAGERRRPLRARARDVGGDLVRDDVDRDRPADRRLVGRGGADGDADDACRERVARRRVVPVLGSSGMSTRPRSIAMPIVAEAFVTWLWTPRNRSLSPSIASTT